MMYKCPECDFTGEGWHRWNCSRGRAKHVVNPTFTPVLEHFANLGPALVPAPEMLPIQKDDENVNS